MTSHGRADVLTMLRAVMMLEPDAVVLPHDAAGKPALKLGDVCRMNGIALSEDDAHDATRSPGLSMAASSSAIFSLVPSLRWWAVASANASR